MCFDFVFINHVYVLEFVCVFDPRFERWKVKGKTSAEFLK